MDKVLTMETVLAQTKQFATFVKEHYPDAQVWLYGSYAKGKATSASDIDIAVILPNNTYNPKTYLDIQYHLFSNAIEINDFMEPCLFIEGTDLLDFVNRCVKGPGIQVA